MIKSYKTYSEHDHVQVRTLAGFLDGYVIADGRTDLGNEYGLEDEMVLIHIYGSEEDETEISRESLELF